MFNRLKNLVSLQLGEKFNVKNKKQPVMYILFKLVGFVALAVVTYLIFFLMEKVIFLKPTNSMVLFIIFVSQIITLIANSMQLTESLYGSKDNAILLSLPARNSEIFVSKLIVFFFIELYSNVMFLFPILIGFGLYAKGKALYYILSLVISVFLPLVSVLLGAFISIPLSIIKKVLKRVSILYVFIFIGLLIVLFIGANKLISAIPHPFRLVAFYNVVINKVLGFIEKANSYSLFYKWFSNIIFGNSLFINLLYVLGLIVGLIIINFISSWPLFFKLASNQSESAIMKPHKGKNKVSKNTFSSFYKKELLISLRTFGNVFENYVLITFMPLILFLLNGLFNAFDLNILGYSIVFGFNIIAGAIIMSSSNSASAKALSEEGSEFILLKTSPVNTKLIAWAKVLNNGVISTFLLIISIVILRVLGVLGVKELIFVFFAILFLNIGHIMWSFQLDLKNPQIKDVSLYGNIQNKENVNNSLLLGLIISVLFGALGAVLYYVELVWLFMALTLIFAVWRFIVFNANLNSYFYEIEL